MKEYMFKIGKDTQMTKTLGDDYLGGVLDIAACLGIIHGCDVEVFVAGEKVGEWIFPADEKPGEAQ